MRIKLNFWQTVVLFMPFIIGHLILEFPHSTIYEYQSRLAIANLLDLINLFIVINYQSYLALGFNSLSGTNSKKFQFNVCIPVLFITLYLIYVIFLTITGPNIHNTKHFPGPLSKADINVSTWIILLFLVHAFITFYFLNNQFVAKHLKKIEDADRKTQLNFDFLQPMKMLTKISIWVGVGILAITTIADIVKLGNFH